MVLGRSTESIGQFFLHGIASRPPHQIPCPSANRPRRIKQFVFVLIEQFVLVGVTEGVIEIALAGSLPPMLPLPSTRQIPDECTAIMHEEYLHGRGKRR